MKEHIEVTIVSNHVRMRRTLEDFLENSTPGNIFVDEKSNIKVMFPDRRVVGRPLCREDELYGDEYEVYKDSVQLIVRVRDGYLIMTDDFFEKDGFCDKEYGRGILVTDEFKLDRLIQVVDFYNSDEVMRELVKADHDDGYVSSEFKLLEKENNGYIDDSVALSCFLRSNETIRLYDYFNSRKLVVKNSDGKWEGFDVIGIIKGRTKKRILAVLNRHIPIVLDADKLELPSFNFED